uniref:Uncharacterized protein n=1 Tax=Arundo donax TaxID=35708 RepID=A0A0A9GG88_ARUDO
MSTNKCFLIFASAARI